jgi:hypothetical protein
MKKFILGLTAVATIFVGCGKNNDTNNNQANNNNGYINNNGGCRFGDTYNPSNGLCYPNGQGTYGNGFYADNYSGTSTLRVVNGAQMKEFFKQAMGVCDRAAYNYGQASCDAYVGGSMDMIIQFPNAGVSSLLATIIAQPKYNPYANYQATLPSGWGLLGIALGATTGIYLPDPKQYNGAYRNPLQLEMVVSAINNSTGFEARGYGDYWTGYNRTLLAIQVPTGKIEDNNFNFNFQIQGQTAAQGTFTRCRTQNCNLQ